MGRFASPEEIQQLRDAAERGENIPMSIRSWIRLVYRSILMLGLLIICVPLHFAWRIFAYGSPIPKLYLGLTARVIGARVEKIGTPLRRDVFFIANHISWLDILSLAGASGTAFVAKAELDDVPVIGWLCRLNRTVFVKRENRMDIAAQINDLREALTDNWSVTVFPEGTTTDGSSLLPFKTAMLRVLEPPPPGVLVQPVLIDYCGIGEEIGWVGNESGLHNAKRVLGRKGGFPLRLHFLEPFSPEEFPGRKAIGARARAAIEASLLESLGKPLREFKHDVVPIRYSAPKAAADHEARSERRTLDS